MTTPPAVSIILPTYNRAKYLARALRSIGEQDHRPVEVIVVDDGSTDNTADHIPEQKRSLAERGIELTYLEQNSKTMLDELHWWASALMAARAK